MSLLLQVSMFHLKYCRNASDPVVHNVYDEIFSIGLLFAEEFDDINSTLA